MTQTRMNQKQFIDAVKAFLPECTDPLGLKKQLENEIESPMGFAETFAYITAFDQTGEELNRLHEELPNRVTSLGHESTYSPLMRGVIEARGHQRHTEGQSFHRPSEEQASRKIDASRRKEQE